MSKQDVAVELYYDGAWHDIAATDDVLAGAPIVIRRGQGDESQAPRPAQITMELDNRDDRYRTSNPESALYGKAGRNTPCRVKVGSVVRGYVEASSLSCDQTPDFRVSPPRGRAWTDLEGGGLLQRIGQWTQPLKSPFREFNERIPGLAGYWPAEQPRGSRTLVSTVPGTSVPKGERGFFGFAFDSQHRPLGSAPLMDVGDGAELGINFAGDPDPDSTAGWQLSWAARYEPLGTTEWTPMYWDTTDGTQYALYLKPASGEMWIYSGRGATPVLAYGASYGDYDFTQWTLFSLDCQYSGGTSSIWVNWTNADNSESGFIHTDSWAGPTATLEWWSVTGVGNDVPPGSTMGHVIGVNTRSSVDADLFGSDRIEAWTGYLGEIAAIRFARLCDQLGVPYYVSPRWAESAPMGPQPVEAFPEQLREIADTEDGIVHDLLDDGRIRLLCRADRYNQTPALDLTPADLPALPREVTDDLPIHNIVTAAQRDGGEVTAEDATGPLGTQPPPDGAGEYRQTVDVNVADTDRLIDVANWWLGKGTVDLPRFPQVVVDLTPLGSSKIAEVEAVDVGDVITLTGFREYVIRLYVLGYTEVIETHTRRITFVCAPDQQYDVGEYDGGRRYGSATTTLAEDLTTTETIWDIRTVDPGDVWSTTAGYDVIVGGEVCTTTNVTAAVLSGGYWTQTMTCTRSVNGIVKTHATGDQIQIAPADRGRYAL